MELYDKEGNPLEDIYDQDGNPINETLTPEEVEQKIQDAKDEVAGEHQTKVEGLEADLEEKNTLLKTAEESLGKEQEKDKNFGKLRGKKEEEEGKVKDLEGVVEVLKKDIDGIKTDAKRQPVNTIINKLAGDDEELKKKIKFHYASFVVPEEDTEEKQKERIDNAYTLASGLAPTNSLSGEAVGSGGGNAPGTKEVESKGKLSSTEASELGEKMGISLKEQKRNKLI